MVAAIAALVTKTPALRDSFPPANTGKCEQLALDELELGPGGRWRPVEHTDEGVREFEEGYREMTPSQQARAGSPPAIKNCSRRC
jgi:hypothetical protein